MLCIVYDMLYIVYDMLYIVYNIYCVWRSFILLT